MTQPRPAHDAEDFGWWQGTVDARITDQGLRIGKLEAADDENVKAMAIVLVELAKLTTRVGLLIGVCTAIGGGIVAIGVYFVTHH